MIQFFLLSFLFLLILLKKSMRQNYEEHVFYAYVPEFALRDSVGTAGGKRGSREARQSDAIPHHARHRVTYLRLCLFGRTCLSTYIYTHTHLCMYICINKYAYLALFTWTWKTHTIKRFIFACLGTFCTRDIRT